MATINANYGIQSSENSQKYPALQALEYRPRTLDEDIPLCIAEKSIELLSDDWKGYFLTNKTSAVFDKKKTDVYVLPKDAKYVFLGIPRIFAEVKGSGEVKPLQRGVKMIDINAVTATRCLVCVSIGNEMIIDTNGCPQFFTLKLKSNKTKLIDDFEDKEFRSLRKLNQILIEHYKLTSQSWTHLVQIGLKVVIKDFTSKSTGKSSVGIQFEFEGKAEPLVDELQQQMFLLAQSDEVKKFLADPFGLSEKKEGNGHQSSPYDDIYSGGIPD